MTTTVNGLKRGDYEVWYSDKFMESVKNHNNPRSEEKLFGGSNIFIIYQIKMIYFLSFISLTFYNISHYV